MNAEQLKRVANSRFISLQKKEAELVRLRDQLRKAKHICERVAWNMTDAELREAANLLLREMDKEDE